jgi:hypothetical protein
MSSRLLSEKDERLRSGTRAEVRLEFVSIRCEQDGPCDYRSASQSRRVLPSARPNSTVEPTPGRSLARRPSRLRLCECTPVSFGT